MQDQSTQDHKMWLPFNGNREKNRDSKNVTPDAKDSASVGHVLSIMHTIPAISEIGLLVKKCSES